MKQGDRVYVSGDSAELWIEDYNVRVSTNAIVEETPKKNAKKVLLTLDSIDGESNVCCMVRRSKVRPMTVQKSDFAGGLTMRKIIAMIELYDGKAIKEDLGTIDYLEREFGWLSESGIILKEARILDDDDEYDVEAIELANKIFG